MTKYAAGAATVLMWCLVVVTVILAAGVVKETAAVTCSVLQLSPCAGAVLGSLRPSKECCTRLREQRPCLCGYLKNPNLRDYVNSPNARNVGRICDVSTPNC